MNGDSDKEYEELAREYQYEIDLAFFVVNFGFTKKDYNELTNREIQFIKKAYENKLVSDGYSMYNACFTAFYNVNRRKNKRPLKLFNKKKVSKGDLDSIKTNLEIIEEVDKKEGKSWVEAIYKANGIRKKGVK